MPSTPTQDPSIDYESIDTLLRSATDQDAYSIIVNEPYTNKVATALLFLGFICLYIVDEKVNKIQLVAYSNTEEYKLSVEKFEFDPGNYALDFKLDKDNTIVQAITTGTIQSTSDWATFCRPQTPVEVARLNQANSGIAYSCVYPFSGKIRGGLMFNYYQYMDQIGDEQAKFMRRYTDLVEAHLAKRAQS